MPNSKTISARKVPGVRAKIRVSKVKGNKRNKQDKDPFPFSAGEEAFLRVANTSIKTTNLFIRYLTEYKKIPEYKRILKSMIDFGSMYQPITRGVLRPGWLFNDLKDWNEYRAAQRAQVYMNKRDIVTTRDSKGGRRLVVTSRGHKIYYKSYPLARLRQEKWDGIWTLVMYDIPERTRWTRMKIRGKLMDLGFGSPQISILVSPLRLEKDIKKLIEGEKLEKLVWVTTAKGILGMSNREVAEKAWPLRELSNLYQVLYETLPKIRKSKSRRIVKKGWRSLFLAVNFADPMLPRELLPEDWYGDKCVREYKKSGLVELIDSLLAK